MGPGPICLCISGGVRGICPIQKPVEFPHPPVDFGRIRRGAHFAVLCHESLAQQNTEHGRIARVEPGGTADFAGRQLVIELEIGFVYAAVCGFVGVVVCVVVEIAERRTVICVL